MQNSLPTREVWRLKGRTLAAMAALCRARAEVALIPFSRWRDGLGFAADPAMSDESVQAAQRLARHLARHVERAATRLPLDLKCLPQAMALSRMLSARGISHAVVFAVRPPEMRDGKDTLHAWVETGGARILGDLPGPWHETLRLDG